MTSFNVSLLHSLSFSLELYFCLGSDGMFQKEIPISTFPLCLNVLLQAENDPIAPSRAIPREDIEVCLYSLIY